MVEAGGGVSTDQGILAKGRTTHRNLGGFGHSISGLGQVGYGWLGDEWRLDTQEPVWKAALLYEAPYVPGPGKRLVMELLLGEAIREPTYRLTQTGGSVGLRWNPSDQWSIFVDYRVQMRVLEDADPGALVVGDPWLETLGVDDANTDAFYTPSDPRLNSGPSALLRFDGRDDRFDPKEGLLVSMRFEVGDGFLADPVRVRSQTRLEELVPAGPVILALGGQFGAGWVAGEGTLPLEERFYLGGNSSFRGFLLNRVGPANHSARPDINYPSQIEPVVEGLAIRDDSDHWVATGGDAMGALSMEVRVPMSSLGMPSWDTTSMVFFCDVGRVGFLNPNIATTSQLEGRDPLVRVGLGTGIRFASPIGPASVELGFNPWRLTERDEAFIVPHLSLGAL